MFVRVGPALPPGARAARATHADDASQVQDHVVAWL